MGLLLERSCEMEENKVCLECGARDGYEWKDMVREYEGDGYHFEIPVKIPFCRVCGAPVYDEEAEREIARNANKRIREQREIITREEILDILERYHVSQKFLSKLLGWGEITLTRYIAGNYTPNNANSNRLKELRNPYVFQMLLQKYKEERGGMEEEKSFQKARAKMRQEFDKLGETQGKIFDVVNWFLAQSSEEAPITHLAMQKLLYFVQCWSMALLGREMFSDDCQAWAHGAVYPKVYPYFKWFKYQPLPRVEETVKWRGKELEILKAVKTYYFDIYSARALEEICHREEPYQKAKKGCPEGEACHAVMDKEDILSYYRHVARTYGICASEMSNVKEYLNCVLK